MVVLGAAAVSYERSTSLEGSQAPRDVSDAAALVRRMSSLLTTYWSESILSSSWFGGPTSRHKSLNSLFQVALYLPSSLVQNVWPFGVRTSCDVHDPARGRQTVNPEAMPLNPLPPETGATGSTGVVLKRAGNATFESGWETRHLKRAGNPIFEAGWKSDI